MANSLLELPESGVWVHEMVLHKIVGTTSGPKFGHRDCLTFLIQGVEKGYWGNKKGDSIRCDHGALIGFAQEGTDHKIAYQNFGRDEPFPSGHLDTDPIFGRPRWFRSGQALMDVQLQLQIVEELMGESPGLKEDVELRRQANYSSFVKGIAEDGGYSRFDVPYVAYEYRDVWGADIAVNERYHHRRRAFKPKDFATIENYMRLMVAASNKAGGQLQVNDDKLIPSSSSRPARGNVIMTINQSE